MEKLLFALTLLVTCSAWAAPCYDLSKGEPRTLSGKLIYEVFPGPPNFEDVKKGDTPEPTYILKLVSPICLKDDDFADPEIQFNSVHLGSHGKEVYLNLKSFVNKNVTVNLSDPYAAHTAHHHDLPPASRTNVKFVKSVTMENDGHEEEQI